MLREFRRKTAGQREPAHLEVGDRAPDGIDGDEGLGAIDQAVRCQRDGVAEQMPSGVSQIACNTIEAAMVERAIAVAA